MPGLQEERAMYGGIAEDIRQKKGDPGDAFMQRVRAALQRRLGRQLRSADSVFVHELLQHVDVQAALVRSTRWPTYACGSTRSPWPPRRRCSSSGALAQRMQLRAHA